MLMDSTTPKPPVRQEAKPSLASWKLRGALQISLACSSDTGIARPAWQRLEARFWFKSGAGLTNQTAKWPYCLTSHIWIVGTVASSPTHIVAAAKSKASQTTPLPRGKSRTQHPENFTSLAPSSVQQQSYHILQNTQKLCCETSHVTNIHTIYIYRWPSPYHPRLYPAGASSAKVLLLDPLEEPLHQTLGRSLPSLHPSTGTSSSESHPLRAKCRWSRRFSWAEVLRWCNQWCNGQLSLV